MMIPSLYDLVHDNICKKELIIEPQVLASQRREKRQRFNTYICPLMDECDFDLLVILRETNHFIRNKKNNVCIPLYIFFYDGQQQFHQYQQNNQLPLTSTH